MPAKKKDPTQVLVYCVGCEHEENVHVEAFTHFGQQDPTTGLLNGRCPSCGGHVMAEKTDTLVNWASR